jgi:hypothetical protein
MMQNLWAPRLIAAALSLVAAGGILTGAPGSARADAEMTRYRGIHPVSPHVGGFCYIDAVHVHRVSPPDMRVYVRLKTGEFFFVGDQIALGYDGPKHGYFGPHLIADPMLAGSERIFCYLAGAHYHSYPSPAGPPFVSKDDVVWYVGDPPPPSAERSWINEVNPAVPGYAPPKVDLSMAPPGYKPMRVYEPPPPIPPPAPAKAAPAKPTSKPKVTKAAASAPGGTP